VYGEILSLGTVLIRTLPGAGSVLDNMVSLDHAFNIIPVASGYQEIHPYSAMNIDSVKINTSLIMMKECIISYGLHGIAFFVTMYFILLVMGGPRLLVNNKKLIRINELDSCYILQLLTIRLSLGAY
jgi:hypothetical protein